MSTPLLSESPAALATLAAVEVTYTDLDGTLLGLGGSLLIDADGGPSTITAQAVTRVNAAGLVAVITTGRNRIQCAEIARLLGWRAFIAELGCVIVPDRGADPIFNIGDWPEGTLAPAETPAQRIARAGATSALMQAFPGLLEPHAPYHLNREGTVLLRGLVDLEKARSVLAQLDVPVALVDNGIVHPVATGLAEPPEIHAYHLMPPGVSKTTAIRDDLARRGLTRARAAAIGDAVTDVEMADACALGVVVANALEDAEVREAANTRDNVYTTTGRRGEGWAEYADAWIGARGTI
jgi:3-deoxy-D-manno-octulosonate 8-phosphate phosphatase KdsC-like HAD superfamily phosphatase